MNRLPYLFAFVLATVATIDVRPAGWLDRLVQYHKKRFLQDLNEVAPVKIKVTVEPMQTGYVDSKDWDFDSVMRLLALIRDSEDAAPARMAIRRALQPSRRFISKKESFKLFPSLMQKYNNNFYYDIEEEEETTISSNSSSKTSMPFFDENAILLISNPVEARLPSPHISVRQLKEIMENRAREQRMMPPKKRPTTKSMKRKQTSTKKATVGAETTHKSEVTTIKIEDDGQPTTNDAETEANGPTTEANSPTTEANSEDTTTVAPSE